MLWSFWFYVIGSIADAYTTKRLVLDKKVAKEVNPIVAWIMDKVGDGMINFGIDRMHKAEIALYVMKALLGIVIYLSAADGVTWYGWYAGGIFMFAAISNKWGLLTKLIRYIKRR